MTEKTAVPRVVVADDHPGILNQVANLLSSEFEIVATAQDGITAMECIRRFDPDIALLDLYMPGTNGLEVVRILKGAASRTIAVIMTGYQDPELAKAAIAAGAMAFVTKSRLYQDLLPAMRGVVQGQVFVSGVKPPNDDS